MQVSVAFIMLGRKRGRDDIDDPSVRMQTRLRDIMAENMLPANRTAELLRDVAAVDPSAPRVLRGSGSSSSSSRNAARDLCRAYLRNSTWPEPYECKIRTRNPRTEAEEVASISFALPHEYLFCIHADCDEAVLFDLSACDPLTLRHLQYCETASAVRLVPLGLWGDGVPIQWERAETIETLSMNFCGISGPHRNLRLPLVTIASKHVCGNTWTDISEVLAWSFRQCTLGTWPSVRHDGSVFTAADRKNRRGWSGRHIPRPIAVRGVLVEMRMDWKYYVSVLGLPAHNLHVGNCWRCNHTPAQVHCLNHPHHHPPYFACLPCMPAMPCLLVCCCCNAMRCYDDAATSKLHLPICLHCICMYVRACHRLHVVLSIPEGDGCRRSCCMEKPPEISWR